MYDISQLNDLLVPELLDIAEQFDIPNAKKLVKQDLINKILENQSNMSTEKKKDDKPKRKRIVKPTAAEAEAEAAFTKHKRPEPEKKPAKKAPENEEMDLMPITDEESTIPPAIAQMLQEEDVQGPEEGMGEEDAAQPPAKQFGQRRDQQAFNIEFDAGP